MSRTGKIARLPHELRGRLNRRLQDGESGTALLKWLNALPEVQEVLKEEFDGRPIIEENLTAWKQGGYRDWERHEESSDFVRGLVGWSDDLGNAADDIEISDRLSAVLAAELARVAEALLEQAKDPRERWDRLREILQELIRLRKEDHKTARLVMDRERWDLEYGNLQDEKSEREHEETKSKLTAPVLASLHLKSMAEAFGGGEAGEKIAAYLLEVKHDLKPGTLDRPKSAAPSKPKPASPDSKPGSKLN